MLKLVLVCLKNTYRMMVGRGLSMAHRKPSLSHDHNIDDSKELITQLVAVGKLYSLLMA